MRKTNRIISIMLALCILLGALPIGAIEVEITEKPADGTTTAQPFAAGTGGSSNFRIPGIVTLDNGTLIASCDARWNHAGDGAGLDTIVSVSTDNGASWTYTFANYMGDNGNVYNNLSTCIIDPAIGTDGTTAYLIADLFPAGIALNTSKYSPIAGENGFDSNGNLQLRALADDTVAIGENGYNTMAAEANYAYYLDLDTLVLYAYGADGAEDAPVEGYTVDAYFNIVSDDGTVNTNLFFSDSPYQPYPTDYLYMTTSTDGLNWSEPTLLNLQEKNEQTLLVGPGNGTYSNVNGHMIFTAYEHTSGYERACLIWRDTAGNWHRTQDATVNTWSSEATSVVLPDGTVRCFYRDGYTALRYTDFVWDEAQGNYVRDTAATEVNTAATVDYGCQLTSIMYSTQIEGKDAVLVAGPTSYRRINGYIYVFLVDEANSMELAYAYNVTPNSYAYSCITELSDGSIGLLYENAGSSIHYENISMDAILDRHNDVRLDFVDVDLLTGDTLALTDNSGYYADAELNGLDTAIATAAVSGEQTVTDAAQLGSDATYSGDTIDLAACRYEFTVTDGLWTAVSTDAAGNTVYLYPGNTTGSGYPNRSAAYSNLSIYEGYEDGTFYIMSNDCDHTNQNTSYLYFDRTNLRWDRVSSPGTNTTWQTNCSLRLYRISSGQGSVEIPGYNRVTSLADVTAGTYLVVASGSDGNLYALYPNTATTNRYCQIAKLLGRTTVGYTDVTITGVGAGYTEVQIGSTVYCITVADYADVSVTVPVGSTTALEDTTGDYSAADLSGVDSSIADVTLTGDCTLVAYGELRDSTHSGTAVELASCEYIFTSTGSADSYYATIEADGSTWYVRPSSKGHSTTQTTLTVTMNDGNSVYLYDGSRYLYVNRNTLAWDRVGTVSGFEAHCTFYLYTPVTEGEEASSEIPGYKMVTDLKNIASGEGYLIAFYDADGNLYCMDPTTRTASAYNQMVAVCTKTANASTQIRVTGVYPGTTEMILGRTCYIITVTGEIVEVDLEVYERESYAIGTAAGLDVIPGSSVSTADVHSTVMAQLGTDATYSGAYVDLADCLYTFTANEDGTYVVSATDVEGNTVYLEGYAATNGYPHVTSAVSITLGEGLNGENTVTLYSDGGYLFFWRNGRNYFDRVRSTGGFEAGVSFHLYEAREDGTYAPIAGPEAVKDGDQYLVVADAGEYGLFVAYPTTDSSTRYAQIGKMGDATIVTFAGIAVGETTARAGSTIFKITVSEHEHTWIDAGCTEPQTCPVCGESAAAVGHTMGQWEVTAEATCTEDGEKARECANCDYVETEVIEAAGHALNEVEHDENGHWYVCDNCDYTGEEEAHSFEDNGYCECGCQRPADEADDDDLEKVPGTGDVAPTIATITCVLLFMLVVTVAFVFKNKIFK